MATAAHIAKMADSAQKRIAQAAHTLAARFSVDAPEPVSNIRDQAYRAAAELEADAGFLERLVEATEAPSSLEPDLDAEELTAQAIEAAWNRYTDTAGPDEAGERAAFEAAIRTAIFGQEPGSDQSGTSQEASGTAEEAQASPENAQEPRSAAKASAKGKESGAGKNAAQKAQ